MGSWLKLSWSAFKIFVSFTACTLLFYFGLLWINQEYQNYHRYDVPKGKAVKVFQNDSAAESMDEGNWLIRLLFFYESSE
ncbi:YqzK family protein [Fictibacillus fluitans]|uniref:YqzK family protein n=1 Tax=Fictibacillus fluitans TaxID=3058422 RepID=A0ABT8I2Q1_9BACL|nr:YqzK family protein [Fictibacillus sp. NE201]MDN4527313.1 YqzK family protein [Fictibacillus sp. NE201]